MDNRHFMPPAVNRRDFLRRAGNGFGAIALAALGTEQSLRAASTSDPLAPKLAHYPARAKRVIFLVSGGAAVNIKFCFNVPQNSVRCISFFKGGSVHKRLKG